MGREQQSYRRNDKALSALRRVHLEPIATIPSCISSGGFRKTKPDKLYTSRRTAVSESTQTTILHRLMMTQALDLSRRSALDAEAEYNLGEPEKIQTGPKRSKDREDT